MFDESVTEAQMPLEAKSGIHEWFELTYGQFLVVPRVVMEAMPQEWQERMVELLDQMDESFDYSPGNGDGYFVRVGQPVCWPYESEDGNPIEPALRVPPEDLCNYRRPSIEHRRKVKP